MPHRPQRLVQLSGSIFTRLDAARRRAEAKGIDVINLSVGSPDLPPPPHVVAALRDTAADPGVYGYPLLDQPAFREAVAHWYKQRFGVRLDPEYGVLGLMGSQEGLAHIPYAFCDPGDLVMIPDPGYPIYHAGPVLAGAEVYRYPLRAENGFLFEPEAIPTEVWERARLLILNYPSNPQAAVASLDLFSRVVEYARRYHVVVLHDAAYSELTFDGYKAPSFLEAPGAMEVALEFNSMSKTFNFAGARVAYAVGNPELVGALAEVKGHLDYGLFLPLQKAAIAALTGPQDAVRATAATYQARRDALVEGLRAGGWEVPLPRATMFLWARIPQGDDDVAFCADLLERTGVILTPGSGFGPGGRGYVRMALVQPVERLEEAAGRIARVLASPLQK